MSTLRIQGPELSESSFIEFGAEDLSGLEIEFELQWMSRERFWTLAVIDVRRERIIDGIRVVAGTDMWLPYSDLRLPPGKLICHDGANLFQDPGRNDWRERHNLYYVEPEEVVEENHIRIAYPVS